MAKSHLKLVPPATVNRTVQPVPPGRRPNAELRSREHLTEAEIERLIDAAKSNRHGHRDAAMLLAAFRHPTGGRSASNDGFAARRARDIEHSRRAKVAPLLAAGMSVRAISAETGISVGAVHRAKRQLEKTLAQGKQQAAAVSQQLPTSYVVKSDIGGVPQDVRRLTASVFERAVESAIGRGLLDRSNRDSPWAVISALFASMFDDHTIEWLNKRGYLKWA